MAHHIPRVDWDGPTTGLHLRQIDDTLVLFDADGRMLRGVRKVHVAQDIEDATTVTVEIFIEKTPR